VKFLAFDTSTHLCTVAVIDTAKPSNTNIVSQHKNLPMQQGQLILPMIDAVLEQAGIKLADLDAIGYGQGPGSYTGTRIAASVAQGLGFATQCPLIPISSLLITAQSAHEHSGWENVIVALDARAAEIYWAAFTINAQGLMIGVGQEYVTAPEKLITPFMEKAWFGVGSGWAEYGEILNRQQANPAQAINGNQLPSAEAMLLLLQDKWEHKLVVSPEKALPVYLR
jgi:tRNA threonylcarbamoyladenosine biosynthesis protein TsaB